jgi:hypothetical protein
MLATSFERGRNPTSIRLSALNDAMPSRGSNLVELGMYSTVPSISPVLRTCAQESSNETSAMRSSTPLPCAMGVPGPWLT